MSSIILPGAAGRGGLIAVRDAGARHGIPPMVGPGKGVGSFLTEPVTEYTHLYGSGDRSALWTVTASFTPDGGAMSNAVDGDLSVNTTGGWDMPGIGSTAIIDGEFVRFDAAVPIYMTEVNVLFDPVTPPNHGLWGMYWLEGAIWTLAGSGIWNVADLKVPLSGVPYTGFKSWKWAKIGAGSNWTNSYALEWKFKCAYGAV